MASLTSRIFNFFLKLIGKKKLLGLQLAYGKFDFYKCLEPPRGILRICNVEKHMVSGRHVFILTPKKNISKKHILYLHGGAYVQNFTKQHWSFLATLVKHTHCTVTAPDYPLAPAYTYVDSFDMVVPLYKALIAKNGQSDFILMGDSAGGGFALSLAQKMKGECVEQPGQIILLSPWLDITLQNPDIQKTEPYDPFLGIDGLRKAGRMYAGDTSPDHYLLSPLNGPLDGLGKISLFMGTRDLLVADARKFNELMKATDIPINYFEYEGMIHVWMLLNFPESKKARQEIIGLINKP